jgi:hypothetical protein
MSTTIATAAQKIYPDLHWTIRHDKKFQRQYGTLMDKIRVVETKEGKTEMDLELVKNLQRELLDVSKMNLAVFAPSLFPRAFDNKPLTFSEYPQVYSVLQFLPGVGSITTKGARQLSKTVSLTARQLMLTHLIDGFSSLYIVPYPQQKKVYGTRLKDMYQRFRIAQKHTNFRNNLYLKEFPTGQEDGVISAGLIMIVNMLTNSDAARGGTFDELIFDELQDIDPNLIEETLQLNQASRLRTTLYSGSSKTTDTYLETAFQMSTASEWVVKCAHCGFENWADLDCQYSGPEGVRDIMDMIQPQGPSCLCCGKVFRPETGRVVMRHPERLKTYDLGIHIPQIMVPGIVNNPARWRQIVRTKKGDRRKYLNETLGVAVSEGESEISEAQLKAICTLKLSHTERVTKAFTRQYRIVVSGIDYGGSDHQTNFKGKTSFTRHVIIGIDHDDERHIDILHMSQHSGRAYEEIIDTILYNHRKFGATAFGVDHGGGDYYNHILRDRYPSNRFFVYDYSGPNTAYIAEPQVEHFPNTWMLNRTESISKMFGFIKTKRYRCYDWDEARADLMEILNLHRAPQRNDQTGRKYFRYIRPSTKVDDLVHALNFATVTAQLLTGEELFEDEDSRDLFYKITAAETGTRMGAQREESYINPDDDPYRVESL